jgi:hypothetical protein
MILTWDRYHHESHTRRYFFCAMFVLHGGSSSLFRITFRCYSHVSGNPFPHQIPPEKHWFRFGSVHFGSYSSIYLFVCVYIYDVGYVYLIWGWLNHVKPSSLMVNPPSLIGWSLGEALAANVEGTPLPILTRILVPVAARLCKSAWNTLSSYPLVL